jgi:hypothetical protein
VDRCGPNRARPPPLPPNQAALVARRMDCTTPQDSLCTTVPPQRKDEQRLYASTSQHGRLWLHSRSNALSGRAAIASVGFKRSENGELFERAKSPLSEARSVQFHGRGSDRLAFARPGGTGSSGDYRSYSACPRLFARTFSLAQRARLSAIGSDRSFGPFHCALARQSAASRAIRRRLVSVPDTVGPPAAGKGPASSGPGQPDLRDQQTASRLVCSWRPPLTVACG